MRIVILTNTFTPHVGGVAKSVQAFTDQYRGRGHRVLVVAPEFENMPGVEEDVIRVLALQNFNGSDFSVPLPIPHFLDQALNEFKPQIVHSNHPFLLGDTALRIAAYWNIPVVFTHHTMYEKYTHYTPADSQTLQHFVMDLATRYANQCNAVVAPSESIAAVLKKRGVIVPIDVIPTGVDLPRFERGDGNNFRREMKIPEGAFTVGHVGRLAPEKNLAYLAEAVCKFLQRRGEAVFAVCGAGASLPEIEAIFEKHKLRTRLYLGGVVTGQRLIDAYHALDLFAFASKTETQGMVLTEALAAGVPLVALDAPGARDVVRDGYNGLLLSGDASEEQFALALEKLASFPSSERERMSRGIRETAERFSLENCVDRALALYERLIRAGAAPTDPSESPWSATLRLIEKEWRIWWNVASAAGEAALFSGPPLEESAES